MRFRFRDSEVLLFQIIDPAEMDLPYRTWMEFRDPESPQTSLRLDANWMRKKYRENLENHLARLRDACRGAQIDYQLVSTDTPFDLALARYLSKRRLKRI